MSINDELIELSPGLGEFGTLGTVATDSCPCVMDESCEQDCCIEALRASHEERLRRLNVTDSARRALHADGTSLSSYGSIDGLNGKLVTPVDPMEGDDREPLLITERDFVSV